MAVILVTGGTGTLGKPTVERLKHDGHDVRVLSRKPGAGRIVGDLKTGEGVDTAIAGVDTVVHLATTLGAGDVQATRVLLDAAERAGAAHLVYISIVGIDRIPFGYYKAKVACEEAIVASSVPHTILRATQFHNLVAAVFSAQRYFPVILAPSLPVQPIAVEEVAGRLAELSAESPTGRVADIGGPAPLTGRELAEVWKTARQSRRMIVPFRLPGKTFRAVAAGSLLATGAPYGTGTFAEFIAAHHRR